MYYNLEELSHIKLKSLEIQGFKSFNDKTVLHFHDAITCIVGPNGCGKSNIVDAIRWVMGEQSAKHLRGKEMEDVIFSGSAKYLRSGMAFVELTFHTEGFPIPPPFQNLSEIAIGRKLFRTGESEYTINRQPVRRKDVTELFLGTGIGTKAYSIIEQGRVEQIIVAKPEDRRTIVEEVAGISKFKIRKEAALRRMEATQQNLLRLQDILTELERQMGLLERHAKRAEKYRKVQDELKDLELKVAAFHFKKLAQRQNDLLARIKELDEKEISLASAVSGEEGWVEEKKVGLTHVETLVKDAQLRVYELTNILKLTESKTQNRKNEREVCFQQIDKIENDLLKQKSEREICLNSLATTNEKLFLADCACESFAEKIEKNEKGLEQLESAGTELLSLVEQSRHDHTGIIQKLSELTSKREVLTEKHRQVLDKINGDQGELESLSEKSVDLSKLLKSSEDDVSHIKQLKIALTEKTDGLSFELKELKDSVERGQRELAELKESLSQKKSRLLSLEELQRNFDDYHEGPRAILKRHHEGEGNSVLGTVASMIETEFAYEDAVSAVLGEKMQFLVVKGQEEGVACAEYLKSSQSGRGTFIPLDVVLTGREGELHKDVGYNVSTEKYIGETALMLGQNGAKVIGKLESFVTCKNGFDGLKKFLFGDVVLVQTLNDALELWLKDRVAVVTLAGEFVSADGLLTGGTLANTAKSLLEKRREAKELDEAVRDLLNAVSEKELVCLQLSKKIKDTELTLDELKSSQHEEDVKTAQQEKDILHVRKELDDLKQQRGKLSQQIFSSRELREEIEKQMRELNEEKGRLRAFHELAQTALDEKKIQEQKQREDVQRLNDEITQDKIEFVRAREQRTYLAKEVDRLIDEDIRGQKAIFHATEQIALWQKKEIFTGTHILFCEKMTGKIVDRKNVAEEAHLRCSDEFSRAHQDLRAVELKIKAMRQEHNEVKEALNKAKLELAELRANANRTNEQIFERYSLVLSEIYEANLPAQDFDVQAGVERIQNLRTSMSNIGNINLAAIDELDELKTRHDFLNGQRNDLEKSLEALNKAIQKINRTTRQRFQDSFALINEKFSKLFPRLFRGGNAQLILTNPEDILTTGVEIIAQPPGKKLQNISLLSGGEKALTAVSLLFAIFLIKPSPFCLLDEVDAPLDDANVDRYNDIVKEMSQRTQFIVITHNKRTMQMTETLFGVTMQEPGISTLVAVRLGDEEVA